MSPTKKDHIYNLKFVVQETGIKPDTLRAWERRYGLPQPDRTKGGHRLYSDYDIELIKWLIMRQNDGMRINRAIKLWRKMNEEGNTSIFSKHQNDWGRQSTNMDVVSGASLDGMRSEWIRACLAYNERAAENILAQSFARYPLESVCLEIMQNGLSHIGSLWFSGRATVQQEHFASAVVIRKLNTLIAASPVSSRIGTILVASPPHEEHIFSQLLTTLFLRNKGWNVVYLGANVPLVDLDKAISSTSSELIILNATMLHTAASLFEVGNFLKSHNLAFAYGGNIFNRVPEIRSHIPGFFLGEQLDHVPIKVEKLLNSTPIQPENRLISDTYLYAVKQVMHNIDQIEAYIQKDLKHFEENLIGYQIVNEYLGKSIPAAIKLGDIEYLKPEIVWLVSLMKNHAFPSEILQRYLSSYAAAVTEYLSEKGQFIADFLCAESKRLASIQ